MGRVAGGYRIRLLPSLLPHSTDQGEHGFVIPAAHARPGETEYCLRLVPLGGYVKMLGQDDIGPDKASDNPRAFNNKAVWQRAITVVAGVVMNVICGAIIFIVVFAKGVQLPPAVVGGVVLDMPAARAGIEPGDVDEVILGQTKQSADAANLARVAALRAGLPVEVPAYTVMRQCGSGLQAIHNAAQQIMIGEADITRRI